MAKTLGVNARILGERAAGVKRYVQCLLQQWGKMALPFESVTLFSHRRIEDGLLPSGFHNQVVGSKLPNVIWENLLLPAQTKNLDLLFGPSYTIPFGYKGRCVATIHDATQEILPKSFAVPWYTRLRYSLAYRYSARRADMIITNSHTAKRDVIRYYGAEEEKIKVVYLAPDEMFHPVDNETALNSVREKYHLAGYPFVLSVGLLTGRRRVPELIQAFGQLKLRYGIPHKLVVVGINYSNRDPIEVATEAGVADSVVHVEWVTDEELVVLFNAADIFVSPSDYDAFSLPVLEAMACGTPVITSNNSGLKEIAGGAAFMVESNTVDELREAMLAVISTASLRDSLTEKGLQRVKAFSWEKTARETMEVLQQVAEG